LVSSPPLQRKLTRSMSSAGNLRNLVKLEMITPPESYLPWKTNRFDIPGRGVITMFYNLENSITTNLLLLPQKSMVVDTKMTAEDVMQQYFKDGTPIRFPMDHVLYEVRTTPEHICFYERPLHHDEIPLSVYANSSGTEIPAKFLIMSRNFLEIDVSPYLNKTKSVDLYIEDPKLNKQILNRPRTSIEQTKACRLTIPLHSTTEDIKEAFFRQFNPGGGLWNYAVHKIKLKLDSKILTFERILMDEERPLLRADDSEESNIDLVTAIPKFLITSKNLESSSHSNLLQKMVYLHDSDMADKVADAVFDNLDGYLTPDIYPEITRNLTHITKILTLQSLFRANPKFKNS